MHGANIKLVTTRRRTHVAVLVVEVDDQAEGASAHGLGGDERVLEGGLALRGHHDAQLQRREVLDVELEVLRVAEGGVQGLHHKVLRALVGEAQQELDNVVGREVWDKARVGSGEQRKERKRVRVSIWVDRGIDMTNRYHIDHSFVLHAVKVSFVYLHYCWK